MIPLPRLSPHFPKKPVRSSAEGLWRDLLKRFDSGQEGGFFHSPEHPERHQLEAIRALIPRLPESLTDCLFIGIGGSALGPWMLLEALAHRRQGPRRGLRFHFLENPDPMDWELKRAALAPETTLVCLVSQSGTTFETLALGLLALEWLGGARWASHVVCLTNPFQGDLWEFAQAHAIPCLPLSPCIGGRFSLFSPTGLFPLALAGLSPERLLAGARAARDFYLATPPLDNVFFSLSESLIALFPSHPVHVFFPYSTRLRALGTWFVQLWAESLGKDRKGFTPLAALGATDQHSLLQLLRDGPQDKVTFFIAVGFSESAPVLPNLGLPGGTFQSLAGKSLEQLLQIELEATQKVLTRQGQPFLHWSLPALEEFHLGALCFSFCTWVSLLASFWEVNPFDQPGVEEGKGYIRKALGSPLGHTTKPL